MIIFWGQLCASPFYILVSESAAWSAVSAWAMAWAMPPPRRRQTADGAKTRRASEFATVRQIAWCTVPRIDLNLQLSGNTCERMHDAMHEQARETCARCRINHASRHTREPASTEHSKKQHDTVRKMRKNTRATVCDTRKNSAKQCEKCAQNTRARTATVASHSQNMHKT